MESLAIRSRYLVASEGGLSVRQESGGGAEVRWNSGHAVPRQPTTACKASGDYRNVRKSAARRYHLYVLIDQEQNVVSG